MKNIFIKSAVILLTYIPCWFSYYLISNTGPTYSTRLEDAVLHAFDLYNAREIRLTMEYLSAGDDPNQVIPSFSTPLHLAASHNRLEIIQALIDHGAIIDRKTCRDGETPLMHAARDGRKESLLLLLKNGADKSLKSKDGRTAEDFAASSEIKEILHSSGENQNEKN